MTSRQRYDRSEKGRQTNRRAVRKYIKTRKGKKTRAKYQGGPGKESHQESCRKYKDSEKGQINQRLWNKGLSNEEKQRARTAWENFNGLCDCCGQPNRSKKGWCLDHKNRKFRGILCLHCNFAAGHVRDSVKICILLADYLRRTK